MTDEISPPPSPQPEVEAPWLIGQRNIFLSGLSHITHAAFSTEYANLHFSTSDLSPQLRNVEQAVTAVKQIVCGDTTRPIQQYLEDSGLPFVSSDPRIQAAAVYDMANAALRFRETPPEIKRAIVTMRVMTDLESDDPEVLSWVLDGISPGEDNKGTLDESMIGEDLVAEFHKPLVDRLVVLYQSDLPDALHRKIAPLLSRYLPESPAATEDEVLYKHIWETCVQSPTNGEAYLLGMAILGRFQNPNISYKSVVEDIARLKDVRDGYAPRALWPVFYFTFNPNKPQFSEVVDDRVAKFRRTFLANHDGMLELIDASEAERLLRMESAIVEDEYKLRIVDILIDRLMGVRTVNIGEKMHEIEILAGDETLNIIKRVITTSEGAVKERLITRLDTVLAQREWVQKEIKELGAKDDSQSEDERHSLEELERSAKSLELLYEEIYDPDAKYRNVPLEYLLRYLPTDGK